MHSESFFEGVAHPFGEAELIIAKRERFNFFYAAQMFRASSDNVEYYAIRIHLLGTLNHTEGREVPTGIFFDDGSNGFVQRSIEYRAWDNAFHAIVNTVDESVKFGPTGQIKVSEPEHRGLGIGSLIMSLVIRNVKKHHSSFRVIDGSLSSRDVASMESEDFQIRHKFYKGLGFEIEYTDDQGNGRFYADSVAALRENIKEDRITVLSFDELFLRYGESVENLSQANRTIASLNEDIKDLEALQSNKSFSFFTPAVITIAISLGYFLCVG